MSGIQKNQVNYFAVNIHRDHGYERLAQSIKSIVIDVYNKFSSQSFDGSIEIAVRSNYPKAFVKWFSLAHMCLKCESIDVRVYEETRNNMYL